MTTGSCHWAPANTDSMGIQLWYKKLHLLPCCEEAEVSQVETAPRARTGYLPPTFNSLMNEGTISPIHHQTTYTRDSKYEPPIYTQNSEKLIITIQSVCLRMTCSRDYKIATNFFLHLGLPSVPASSSPYCLFTTTAPNSFLPTIVFSN